MEIAGLREEMEALGLVIEPFDAVHAEAAARFRPSGSRLSLADRACLALGLRHGIPVWTADRMWAQVSPEATIRVIR